VDVLIAGFLAGLALAIPLGPMAILLISTTLKYGRKIGAFGALAMASVDLLYAATVFAFGQLVISQLTDWVLPLRILGSAILIFVALKIFIEARGSAALDSPDLTQTKQSSFKTYAKFFGLTVLNPATAFYFFGITPSVATLATESSGASTSLFALGVFIGSVIWQLSLVFAAHLTKAFTSAKVQHRIQYFGATLIALLAIGLLVK
jgi:threonine/homoserine/homoserine lactone efflux protein